MRTFSKFILLGVACLSLAPLKAENRELQGLCKFQERGPGDIHEHLKHLRRISSECASVMELGVRGMVSTYGVLAGLDLSKAPNKSYIGVDLFFPPVNTYRRLEKNAKKSKISFEFIVKDDAFLDPIEVDMLFIDTLHTYAQLTFELEKFSPYVKKYITMHDTDAPWGFEDEPYPYGNSHDFYPKWIDKTKRGLLAAADDFLERHPEWELAERYTNCHGFTVLKRRY
jgi:hypothetical protein